ncbi:hypothetical protein SDC9_189937 [bioreactor metagenome]|uniref:Secretion system C-terminal sorting domain-containing protein n=1 Tax=bioreactor metagenome TaxID=1076179 RepID=A0A645HU41_9ZZZZ
MYVTTKLFNDDEKIEFIYEFSDVTYTNTLYKLTNEDGENLFDFVNEVPSNTYTAKTGDFIFTTSSKINNVWYTNFYSTQKKSTQTESLSLINRVVQPFPNPADQIIYLPYHIDSGEHTDMKIFDVNGKLIDEKKIDKASDKVVLNISDYKTGTYIYRYNNKSEKFIVR